MTLTTTSKIIIPIHAGLCLRRSNSAAGETNTCTILAGRLGSEAASALPASARASGPGDIASVMVSASLLRDSEV